MQAEKHIPDASALSGWRKSSYSGGGDDHGPDECLEVADGHPGILPVRDSKNPQGPAVLFAERAWAAFIGGLKNPEK
ncbi:DUF397 domain-containing protein [Streptomyces sp. 6N223]|uniref:DUF397 domain-containing protein n=1 Tax=Streptomyces sp. 6N223 TaxID=3457412 RepID=UPI003FD4FA50